MTGRVIIILLLFKIGLVNGQDLLNKDIALHVKDLPIKDVLDQISENTGVYFTYAGNIKAMDKKISLNIDKVPLNRLLSDLFYGEDVIYTTYANQIILKIKPEPAINYNIQGIILSSETQLPVEFASLQFKQSKRGTVAGLDGKFSMAVSAVENGDSISIFCIGFEPRTLSLKFLSSLEFHKIFLKPRLLELDPVEFSVKKAELHREGNKGIPMGSLYLDTHGQQVALFIENRKKKPGRLKSLSFYLSGKGNTEAPFRIRIYGVNDSLHCPGEELLPDILIVKPDIKRGWFETDIAKYNIRFPESGVFVAMEGIYPGDYLEFTNSSNSSGKETLEDQDEFIEGQLEYGQRLGYNRFSKNETWHFSLSHTWFQLNKKLFNVMITAEILVYDPQKSKKQKS